MKFLVILFASFVVAIWAHPLMENDPEQRGGNFEGDMELDVDQLTAIQDSANRNGLLNTQYRWPNRVVYYEIDSVFDSEHANHIIKGLNMLEAISCVRFVRRTPDIKDYIHVTGANSGCHSAVGRRGGKQTLNLQIYPLESGCFRIGTVMHEFLHALGFYHQQSATNRDDYVTIIPENVESGKLTNFIKYYASTITDFGFVYDYDSVMHYGATAFSKNGEKTIVTKDPLAVIGQRVRLSEHDIGKLNAMYECNI